MAITRINMLFAQHSRMYSCGATRFFGVCLRLFGWIICYNSAAMAADLA